MLSDASRKARHEFRKSPPGKAGFRISDHVLGACPFLSDQLQQRLAAVTQAIAFLDLIEHGDSLSWQLEQHFLTARRPQALAVGAGFLG